MYDGHESEYVSEYLQTHLHFRFNEKLLLNGGLPALSPRQESGSVHTLGELGEDEDDCSVRISLLEACCAMEREILAKDSLRLQSRNSRVRCLKEQDLDWEEDSDSPRSRSNSEDSESLHSPTFTRRSTLKKKKSKKSSKGKKKSVLCDSGSGSFAGSTAVVAILYSGCGTH